VSCKIISIDEFDKTIPDNPPIVNKKINPIDHIRVGDKDNFHPYRVVIHLKTLIPVGIIIVADVK